MNTVEKDNIVQKAICCSGTKGKQVADMLLSGDKCADKELQKLILLNSYIESLGCYRAPLETTTYTVVVGESIWEVTVPCATWDTVLAAGTSAILTIDGTPTTFNGDDATTLGDGIITLLQNAAATISVYSVGACVSGNLTILLTALCDTESIVFSYQTPEITTSFNAVLTTAGNCAGNTLESTTATTTYTNCLTEDQADDIATQISKICDLCDEH